MSLDYEIKDMTKDEFQKRWQIFWGLFDSKEIYIMVDDDGSYSQFTISKVTEFIKKDSNYLQKEIQLIQDREINLVSGGEKVTDSEKILRGLSNYHSLCRNFFEEIIN